ncbi:MAG: hypothetical protein NTX00_03825 [Candidatus Parcubacteria bacterium]|nr:hypothetical protein [Candidatus Parcubacteria bacterium]
MPEKFGEQSETKKIKDLKEYLKNNSKLLVENQDIDKIYKKILGEMKASTTYYDTENIKVNLDGYNLVFTDKEGNLLHSFVAPESILSLSKAGKIGERKELENELENSGYTIDDSEEFRVAIRKLLRKKSK